MYPETIQNLIECYKKFPGVGEKTAERMALATLDFDQELIELFAVSLSDVKKKIKKCPKCHNLTENELCNICIDTNREGKTICVIEEAKNLFQLEKIGFYHGVYHVLDGLISPLDNINPEDINLNTLLKRTENENIKEIIIAVKPSIEGETTALYISKMITNKDIVITKIAHGIPIGADMDYIDSLTLEMALENRNKMVS